MPNHDTTLPLDGRSLEQQRAAGYLNERGIPRSWAMQCGICVQLPERRKGFNGAATKAKERAGAIVIPYFNHDGTQRDFARWRLFNADHKFDQNPGTGVHVYMPPLRHPEGLTMQQVFDDTSIELNIAEGESRALAANYLGEPTVAIGGIDMGVVDGDLCDDLRQIPVKDRKVRLLIDADVARKDKKQNSIIKLARKLEERGADVYLMPAPGEDNEGWDDFIAANSVRAFRQLLKDAKRSTHPDFASWGYDGVDLDLSLSPIGLDWLTEAPPTLEWTWDGYLPRGTVALLNGQGGAGKSFFIQRLLQCIAGGLPFLGLPTRQGKTVHIACEEGPDELRRRQYKTYQHETADMEPAKVKRFATLLQGNLHIRSVIGQQLHLVTTHGNNVIQGRALDILIHQLKALGGVEIAVIDPISRAHSAADENAAAWGTAMMNALARLAIEVGCSAIAVHHTGKGKAQGGEREDVYSGRGSSALPDAARVVLQLKVAKPEECRGVSNIDDEQASTGQILRLINSKQSYGPTQRETWLYRAEGGVLDHFEPERRSLSFNGSAMRSLYGWWLKNGRKPIYKKVLRNKRTLIFGDGVSCKAAEHLFDHAVSVGHLVQSVNTKHSRGVSYTFNAEYRPEDAP